MKNTILIYLLGISLAYTTKAQEYSVNELTAKEIASSFLNSNSGKSQLKSGEELTLAYKESLQKQIKSTSYQYTEQTAYFIYNHKSSNSFVIVAGDKRATPVLGYSTTSFFDPGNIPPNLKIRLDGYKKEIQFAIESDLEASKEVSEQWQKMLEGVTFKSTVVVAPLLETQWDQIAPYNDLCPYDSSAGERTLGGCTATTMAQILKYWSYPDIGIGSITYNPESYPELGPVTVDFGSTHYDWESMPNTISSPNESIAQLLFHTAASVNTDFKTYDNGGSYARVFNFNHNSALLAFRKFFGYKHTNKYVSKSFYASSAEWLNLIKSELDANRPVYYVSREEGVENSRHGYVCDGYDSNNYLHFNWGWGGQSDGYYSIESIDLGYRNYTSNQDAIIGIEPITVNPSFDIRLNSKVMVSPCVYLKEGEAFSVSADLKNFGAEEFNGQVLAYVYNSSGQWVGGIAASDDVTLKGGESIDSVTFSTDGISAMTEGSYMIALWTQTSETKLIESNLGEDGFINRYKKVVVSNSDNPIAADGYENNNEKTNAYELTPVFSDNTATLKFDASIHNTSDLDYFKIELPTNYDYSFHVELTKDCQAAMGFPVFSLDGVFSYQQKDGTWSDPEDLTADFELTGEDDYLNFKVEPSVAGYMGDYTISVGITRTAINTTPVEEISESYTSIYPLPNNGQFTIKLGNDHLGTNKIYISSINGEIISEMEVINPSEITKQINLDVAPGLYLIQIRNSTKNTIRKVIITK